MFFTKHSVPIIIPAKTPIIWFIDTSSWFTHCINTAIILYDKMIIFILSNLPFQLFLWYKEIFFVIPFLFTSVQMIGNRLPQWYLFHSILINRVYRIIKQFMHNSHLNTHLFLFMANLPRSNQLATKHTYPINIYTSKWALKLFLVFLLQSPVFFIVSPAYLEELLTFLVSP